MVELLLGYYVYQRIVNFSMALWTFPLTLFLFRASIKVVVQNLPGFTSLQHTPDSYRFFKDICGTHWTMDLIGASITGLWGLPFSCATSLGSRSISLGLLLLYILNIVEALAVQLTRREGELIKEKVEVKKPTNFLKQASEDAKKLVNEERAFARFEIQNARAAVHRVEEALQEHERMSQASGKQDLDRLMKEVQEARRIKMLHQPSKV
ncbi:hypothetical protein VNO78_12314 [Psophocarpus tetragonolobus]|uniref:Stomatal closure-related actin-binding protein coiled-coil domain-containing protein n=1 Tax=Psophocarpus tetragonolobus TaxID=3891 RepID=A0AAN9XPF3_PSOTE